MLEFGIQVVEGIAKTESAGKMEVHRTLLELRGVLAPEAREAAALFLATGPTVPRMKIELERIMLDQWTAWHWCRENPNINAALSMCLHSLCCLHNYIYVHSIVAVAKVGCLH